MFGRYEQPLLIKLLLLLVRLFMTNIVITITSDAYY